MDKTRLDRTTSAAVQALRSVSLPDVATVQDLAESLHLAPSTVRRHFREGRLPGRLVGRRWYASRVALLAYLASSERRSRLEVLP